MSLSKLGLASRRAFHAAAPRAARILCLDNIDPVCFGIKRRQELGKLAEDNSNLAGGPSAMLWVDRGRHVMLRAEHLCFRLVYSTQRRQNRRRKDGKKSTLLLRGFAKLRGGGGMRPDKMHTPRGGYETLCSAAISSRRTATRGVWFARYFFSFSKPSDRLLAPCTSRTYI